MSLKLEEIEEKLAEYNRSHSYRVLFLYSSKLLSIKKSVDRLNHKLSAGSYGDKTRDRARNILIEYNEKVSRYHPFPPSSRNVDEILLWAMYQVGFKQVSCDITDDISYYELLKDNSTANLRVISLGAHAYGYIDEFGIKINRNSFEPERTVLRFAYACIYPFLYHTPVPAFSAMPVEVIANSATFLSIEDIGVLSLVSKTVMSALNRDTLWEFVYNNLSSYSAIAAPNQPPVTSYKEAVKGILAQKQERRVSRFVRTMQVSHWAAPGRLVDPIPEVRRRRIDVMDDLDLF